MREFLLVFLVAAATTYLLTVIARELAIRTGAVAAVRDRDVHAEPIPYLGGVAMLGGLVAAYVVAQHLPFLSQSDPFVFRDAGSVLIAGALICAVGVLDDIFDINALTKLGGQVLAAGLLVVFEVKFYFFPGGADSQFILTNEEGALLTVLLVVTTVNAVNMVDGLDGLASGVVGIGAAAFFLFCYQLSDFNGVTLATTGALLSAALAGACAGFLPHNFHPARLFMGDSGSMLIGLVMSASALTLTGQFDGSEISFGAEGSSPGWAVLLPLLLPVSLLIVPMTDLLLAVVRRTRAGRSPFAPDKEHLHHRLLEIGHSQRRAVFIMWLWAALISFGAVLVSLYSGVVIAVVMVLATALVIALTFLLPRMPTPHLMGAPLPGEPEDSDAAPTL
ncbi:MraY family glycosyltransferase [Nocardioides jishulii]|uniref:Undecaprenyl/decaprenyl-phosphate alpha-N-acetylglucosaminyl 1-phosphate transferase n=1 Tax=Nocardioides jishulii TaxID=2575440 RepID=A0A4V5TR13_9ACTN|nr:MraY family glycosyltransferase [Nocardioides jishulii]QCX28049.1 undecaprenyl/decaprenyl-phosphate alpha-N-acetylglucosaminyl 1-phosphate transferase [Nocardioides jishulii]TKI60713.1 undecaprenyl/decaprenyl-phosphate alpha-N-acetylglucosaminyl 1-phosphate transferase [Nocardioides jishulii]